MRASLGDVGKRAPADVHDAHKPRGYERAAADAHGLWVDVRQLSASLPPADVHDACRPCAYEQNVRQLMRMMLASLRIVKPAAADAHDAREPWGCG